MKSLKDNKPVWNNQCQQCYACLHWCHKESIQAGKKTVGIKRYHHPNIMVKDIIRSSVEKKLKLCRVALCQQHLIGKRPILLCNQLAHKNQIKGNYEK